MKFAQVIIGSQFGDEGKGLFTDYHTAHSPNDVVVIRFNGGAQAGHTVETPTGTRHVFSHFGAGTLLGASTFLSRFFVCHPLIFMREYAQLQQKGYTPRVWVDPASPITTPYDMMINQIIEDQRQHNRHGSVGIGFGETIERQEKSPFSLNMHDLNNPSILRQKLHDIKTLWTPQRLQALKVQPLSAQWQERLQNDAIFDNFINTALAMRDSVYYSNIKDLPSTSSLIFEGAQGLLLDQSYGWFPHVTRSYTGLRNVISLAQEADIQKLDVTYATRAYLTRHGAGPLPHELPHMPFPTMLDATNQPHSYQGSLRYAWLDIDLMQKTLATDLALERQNIDLSLHLGISCLDQVSDDLPYYYNHTACQSSRAVMIERLKEATGIRHAYLSFGATRATVEHSGQGMR